jgi:anti-sigma regulatory factor (Ser/Thr protein kinase)
MQDLSLHLLDIIENSVRAKAKNITISIHADLTRNRLRFKVEDDGVGMDEITLHRAMDPFYTSKAERTKKVGLGIPLFKQNAENCDGRFTMCSTPGKGTMLEAIFAFDHIDRMPIGSLADTLVNSIIGHPEVDWTISLVRSGYADVKDFRFSTREVREELGEDVPLTYPDVIQYIRETIEEGIANTAMEEL